MSRRCSRPGCGQPAVVVLGFDAAKRLAWLEPVDGAVAGAAPLCERHAERTTVPKGWWLDDRRLAAPTLFRSPFRAPPAATAPAVSAPAPGASTPGPDEPVAAPPRRRRRPVAVVAPPEGPEAPTDEPPGPGASTGGDDPWHPARMDLANDLDGVLDAETPLLRRAFGRPAPRRRSSPPAG